MSIFDLIGRLTWGQYRCENPCYDDYIPYEDGPNGRTADPKTTDGERDLKLECDQSSPENHCTKDTCLKECQKVPHMTCCEYHNTGNCIAQIGPCAANPRNNKGNIDPRPGEYMCATKGKKIKHDRAISLLQSNIYTASFKN